MALDWQKQWSDAKKYFGDTTGKKKPNANVSKIFSKHASGIETAIKGAEKAFGKAESAKDLTQKHIDDFVKAIADFAKVKDNYVKVLEAAVTKEITDKGEKTTYSKSCKYLEKQLEAIQGTMETQVEWLKGKLQGLKTAEVMAASLIKTVQGCVKKCVAAAAKVKTKPTKETFDNTLYTPARDLSQYLGNISVLRKKGAVFADKYDDRTAQALYDVIRPYGDERLKTKLPADASPDIVLTELKKFVNAVKAADDYAK